MLCREIEGLMEGMEGEDEGDEWEEMERRWAEGGDMLHERAYGQQASVDAMARFEDYWLNRESREVIRSTELFQGIDEKDGRKIPKSPKRRGGRGSGRGHGRGGARPRPRPRMRQTVMQEYDSDVEIVAGPSTSNANERGRGRGGSGVHRRAQGDNQDVPPAESSDVEIVSG